MSGDGGDDVLFGEAGDDTIYGGDGRDYLSADDSPFYSGPGGNDTLIGGPGDDFMNGGGGNDILVGGTGYDSISGGDGDDLILVEDLGYYDGGNDDDTFRITGFEGNGAAVLHGGEGDDKFFIDVRSDDPQTSQNLRRFDVTGTGPGDRIYFNGHAITSFEAYYDLDDGTIYANSDGLEFTPSTSGLWIQLPDVTNILLTDWSDGDFGIHVANSLTTGDIFQYYWDHGQTKMPGVPVLNGTNWTISTEAIATISTAGSFSPPEFDV